MAIDFDVWASGNTPFIQQPPDNNSACPQYFREPAKKRTSGQAECNADDAFKKSEDNVLEAKMYLPGQPLLEDKIVIRVAQIDNRWDGNWYITELQNDIGVDVGFTSKVSLVRNSAGSSPSSSNLKGNGTAYNQKLTQPPGANRSAIRLQQIQSSKGTLVSSDVAALIKRKQQLLQLRAEQAETSEQVR